MRRITTLVSRLLPYFSDSATGMSSTIPLAVMPILSWHELEGLICGREGIDLELLKNNTEYDDDGKDLCIKPVIL